VGVENPEKQTERKPSDDLLGFWPRLLVGVFFAGLYMATFVPRQDNLPAVLSGILGGAVVFLILKEADERLTRRRRRERQR